MEVRGSWDGVLEAKDRWVLLDGGVLIMGCCLDVGFWGWKDSVWKWGLMIPVIGNSGFRVDLLLNDVVMRERERGFDLGMWLSLRMRRRGFCLVHRFFSRK